MWNATRFLLMRMGTPPVAKKVKYGVKEKALLAKLKRLTADVTKDMENYRMHHAADKLYHFFWHYYADKVIEEMKPRLDAPDGTTEKETAKALLLEFHRTLMILLHPFMPFITEEIWKHLPKENAKGRTQKENLLIIEKWPTT